MYLGTSNRALLRAGDEYTVYIIHSNYFGGTPY